MIINLSIQARDYYYAAQNTTLEQFQKEFESDIRDAICSAERQIRADEYMRTLMEYRQYMRSIFERGKICIQQDDRFLKWFVREIKKTIKKKK